MKNQQKGFIVPALIAAIALLVIGGGVYFYSKHANPTPKYIKNESALLRYSVLENENLWRTKFVTTDIPVSWNIPSKNIVLKKNQENDFSCGSNKAEFVNYISYNSGNVGGWNNISVIEHDNTNTERLLIKETGLYVVGWSGTLDQGVGPQSNQNFRVVKNGTTLVPGSDKFNFDSDEWFVTSNTFLAGSCFIGVPSLGFMRS